MSIALESLSTVAAANHNPFSCSLNHKELEGSAAADVPEYRVLVTQKPDAPSGSVAK